MDPPHARPPGADARAVRSRCSSALFVRARNAGRSQTAAAVRAVRDRIRLPAEGLVAGLAPRTEEAVGRRE
ncbi:hypothetical protein ACFVWY_13915 [Streptomyces sp. NPDC058195]|uniref:hypothetical protein n=1 Tax=Streptomyces sp. NPDC058195 TaxID=3346375 RepID=UPI0036E26A31